jgi:hypothetical protein
LKVALLTTLPGLVQRGPYFSTCQGGAGTEGLVHDTGVSGVDRKGRVRLAGKSLEHRQDTPRLERGIDRLGARSHRLAADVQDIGARFGEPHAVLDRGLRSGMVAAIGEAVGRDVHDAHEEGSRELATSRFLPWRGQELQPSLDRFP